MNAFIMDTPGFGDVKENGLNMTDEEVFVDFMK
eukprot:CAMPEP_0116922856 /NCGR_PEP_ID=MMETSP0467-20121206/22513_1 /TAXON_ID=283647 /ORGANISM="Mesodinium pulex, Strain SPMC105" /LENGTH=32 /DNA_ID= /DNA_START= /DNA_END= /DNA_ORIENTATION=